VGEVSESVLQVKPIGLNLWYRPTFDGALLGTLGDYSLVKNNSGKT